MKGKCISDEIITLKVIRNNDCSNIFKDIFNTFLSLCKRMMKMNL